MGTTVKDCKMYLEMLESSVTVDDPIGYSEAVDGLKNLQLFLCKALAQEDMALELLRKEKKMDEVEFFKFILPHLMKAEDKGMRNFYEVFPFPFEEDEE